ncbi:LacI family DNA-binding transcriptional regulator [Tuberibacillus calidus]|nr:LacI family DNA-binding transcriptional regulator [Tuberibacillus calidus]
MANKQVTIRDVAKEAGVSVATVSRLINKSGYVSDETENKVKKQ